MKICVVCSHGGHLTEILHIKEIFQESDVFFITYISERTMALPYRKYLIQNIGKSTIKMMIESIQILKIFLKERPDLIISNGAEIAIPSIYIGKILGIRSLFFESYTRISKPTVTGKLVNLVADDFIVLWPELRCKYVISTIYIGQPYKTVWLNEKQNSKNQILVLTGMHSKGFDRLIEIMDKYACNNQNIDVIIQIGSSHYHPIHSQYFQYAEYSYILELIYSSNLVIGQAAMSAVDSLLLNTKAIVLPRKAIDGEAIDDHQTDFAEKLCQMGYVTVLEDIEDLNDIIGRLLTSDLGNPKPTMIIDNTFIERLTTILKEKEIK